MKDRLFLNIAGFNIKINFQATDWIFAYKKLKKEILAQYKGFVVSPKKKIDYIINFLEVQDLLIAPKNKNNYFIGFFEKISEREINTYYQISSFQLQILIREVLITLLAKNKGFIIHGSASQVGDKALVFTGNNGSGKSTITQLLQKKYPILADDTVIIRKEIDKYFVYQTPFIEKNYSLKKNKTKYLLKTIFFLKKDKANKTVLVKDKKMVFNLMLKQFWSSQNFHDQQLKSLLDLIKYFDNFMFLFFLKSSKKLLNFFRLN